MKFTKYLLIGLILIMALTATTPAFAETKDKNLTRDEIEDILYNQYWKDSAIGTENPEGSLEWHILQTFLDKQYPHKKSDGADYLVEDWSDRYYIDRAWRNYHEEYMHGWDIEDEDGEIVIYEENPETGMNIRPLYTFKLMDGMWNLIDSNKNVYDTFEPHGGDGSWQKLQDKDLLENALDSFKDGSILQDNDDNDSNEPEHQEDNIPITDEDTAHPQLTESPDNDGSRVTGQTFPESHNEPVSNGTSGDIASDTHTISSEEEGQKPSPVKLVVVSIIAIILMVAACIYTRKDEKNGNKKR